MTQGRSKLSGFWLKNAKYTHQASFRLYTSTKKCNESLMCSKRKQNSMLSRKQRPKRNKEQGLRFKAKLTGTKEDTMFKGLLTTMKKMTRIMLRTITEIKIMLEVAAMLILQTKTMGEQANPRITPVRVLLLLNQAKALLLPKLSKFISNLTTTMQTVWIPSLTWTWSTTCLQMLNSTQPIQRETSVIEKIKAREYKS